MGVRGAAILTILALLAMPVRGGSAAATFQPNTDMTGGDYRHFALPRPRPRLCQEACLIDATCHAWTYLREGALGPLAICWLKSGTPVPRRDPCCVSGVK